MLKVSTIMINDYKDLAIPYSQTHGINYPNDLE